MSEDTSAELLSLRSKLSALTELHSRLQTLRQIPTLLLRPPANNVHAVPQTALLRHEFQELREVSEALRAEKVQAALVAARESEAKDKSDLGPVRQRENKKRKRAPSPESPQPYRPFEPKSSIIFPPLDEGASPIQLPELPDFLREYNRVDKSRSLQIHSPSRGQPLRCPVILRFTIRDVVTVYLTLDRSSQTSSLVVETASAFGPREQKPPHLHSDYTVYQKLSQQIAKMVQAQPQVPLQSVLSLLASYDGLFVQRCVACERVLSAESHIPPVARLWTRTGSDAGVTWQWEPRHDTCLQR
ncbi:hypothetical protein CERSUDRAFT_162186 [Gelatoporia subvermispora B]|uniref:Mediator complex subunit 27 n=1 Tax=Ceriporiopsis subvermispora (strain B) TaxID=914234 RepID=M2QJ18_CERS8|nr:hypothetical protein CERSUDRAFT_162186 [Gelatoporia subvermispora B]